MNQPTEDRFKRIEEEQRQLKEKVRKLEEQQTEPIKITRLEIDSGSMHKRLDAVQEDTNILKIEMQGARADISIVKANQSDLKEYLKEQFKSVDDKQDAHQELLGQLISVGEELKTTTATKDDISILEKHIDEQGAKLDLILNLLQKE